MTDVLDDDGAKYAITSNPTEETLRVQLGDGNQAGAELQEVLANVLLGQKGYLATVTWQRVGITTHPSMIVIVATGAMPIGDELHGHPCALTIHFARDPRDPLGFRRAAEMAALFGIYRPGFGRAWSADDVQGCLELSQGVYTIGDNGRLSDRRRA